MPNKVQRCPTSGTTNMAIVISSQKMYLLVNNFEDQPAESLMKKRRDTAVLTKLLILVSQKRKRLRQNWRGSRLVVGISTVTTTSPLLAATSSKLSVMESSMESTPHLRLHHHPAPPGTSWWRTNRITLYRKKLLALSRHSPARGSIVLTGAMRYMSHMMMVHARDTSVNIQR